MKAFPSKPALAHDLGADFRGDLSAAHTDRRAVRRRRLRRSSLYKTSLDFQLVELAVSDDGPIRERKTPAILPSDRVTVLDFYGSAFFASSPTLQSLLAEAKESKRAAVTLRFRGRRELGSTFLKVLGRYARELQSNGGKLVLTGVSDDLNEQLGRSKYWELFGAENIFLARDEVGSSTLEAVMRANDWLDSERL